MAKERISPAQVTPLRTKDMKKTPVSRQRICIRPRATATKPIAMPKMNCFSTSRARFVTMRRHSRGGLKKTPGSAVRRSLWKPFFRPTPKRISIGAFARQNLLENENRLLKLQNRLAYNARIGLKKTPGTSTRRSLWKSVSRPTPKRLSIGALTRQNLLENENRLLKLQNRLAQDAVVAKTREMQWFRKTWRQEKQELQNRILELESATDRL